jgi:antitoxin component of RelBE/YafQ-DinJ toxin-antitoxin module
MRTKLLGVKCTPRDKLSFIATIKQAGLSISEALQLYVTHVGYLGDLPFRTESTSDGKLSHKRTSALLVVVNPIQYDKFQSACDRLGLTKSQALHLFVQYCVQHHAIPTLFRPDCKEINKPVIVPKRR